MKCLVDFVQKNIVKFQKQSFGRKNQLNMFTHGPTVVVTLVSKRPLLDKMKNIHHKFIGFMGLFQIHAKSVISWVHIIYT